MFNWLKCSQEKCDTNEPPTAERLISQNNTLDEIRETVHTLVKIANGEKVSLTQRQAYLAVRTMDLTEGYIASVDFNDGKWDKYKV